MTSLWCSIKQETHIFKNYRRERNKWRTKLLARSVNFRFHKNGVKGGGCNSIYWNFYIVLNYNKVYSKL